MNLEHGLVLLSISTSHVLNMSCGLCLNVYLVFCIKFVGTAGFQRSQHSFIITWALLSRNSPSLVSTCRLTGPTGALAAATAVFGQNSLEGALQVL